MLLLANCSGKRGIKHIPMLITSTSAGVLFLTYFSAVKAFHVNDNVQLVISVTPLNLIL